MNTISRFKAISVIYVIYLFFKKAVYVFFDL